MKGQNSGGGILTSQYCKI